MKEENKRLANAVRLWCLCRGYEEMENQKSPADLVFNCEEKTVGFLICDEQADGSFPHETGCDLTYSVINNPENRSAVHKKIPAAWGILCYGNPFGLGYLYQVLREAK